MNFELILTLATLIAGVIALIDIAVVAKRGKQPMGEAASPALLARSYNHLAEYSRSFFPILLLVLLFRSFLFEPFRIPTGSLEPTLLVGDYILVNKFAFGLRLPVLHTKIFSINEPKVGDIVVFRYPHDTSVDYIKRIIGIPGDHIRYVDKVLYVNDKQAPQQLIDSKFINDLLQPGTVLEKQEDLLGIKHDIYQRTAAPAVDFDVVVPKGQYFAMGDNRDDSSDSRYWGFVPEANLAGKAIRIWFSWNNDEKKVRWDRIGHRIN